MKLLIVHRLIASFGGAHKYLIGLIKLLRGSGWEITLLINRNPDLEALLTTIRELDVTVVEVNFDDLGPEDGASRLDKLITEMQPDVIDFQAASKSVRKTALHCPALERTNAVKLFSMHLPITTDQSDSHGIKRMIPMTREYRAIKQRIEFLNLFDTGMSVSAYHAGKIEKLIRLPPGFFTILPNGVDIELFRPRSPRSDDPRKLRIAACGGLTGQKRFDLLISAASILEKAFPNFEVCIAGEGRDRAKLEAQISALGLNGKVHLVGHVSDVAEFLRTVDIYVLCSDAEGFPYAALEAMASGLPSVVTSAGDLPQMIRNEQEGLVVRCGDADELARSIIRLAEDPKLRVSMGNNARVRAVGQYNSQVTWANVMDFYAHLEKSVQ